MNAWLSARGDDQAPEPGSGSLPRCSKRDCCLACDCCGGALDQLRRCAKPLLTRMQSSGTLFSTFTGIQYRLVTVIHYAGRYKGKLTMGHVYFRSFLTHKEYDSPGNWAKEYGR